MQQATKLKQIEKIKISEIKQSIFKNVKCVVGITKQPATNTWFIYIRSSEDVTPAIEVLEKMGFSISGLNKTYPGKFNVITIIAEFQGVDALFPNSLSFNHIHPISLDFPKKIIQCHLYHHLLNHILKSSSRYIFTKHSLYR